MIASLGMYDHPGQRAANDRLWAAIRADLGEGPELLTRDRALMEIWTAPDLLLAQTCGMPYRLRLAGRVTRVGTPDYGLPGCPPGYYHSVMLGRRGGDATQARRFAYNDPMSHSGWAAPAAWMGARGLRPREFVETGGHLQSALAVAEGRADLCGVDARTWITIGALPEVAGAVEAVGRTAPAPGLPMITAPGRDPGPIRRALRAAIAAMPEADRALLGLRGLVAIPDAEYLAQPTPPPPA